MKLKSCPFCGHQAELLIRDELGDKLPYGIVCNSKLVDECFLYSGYEERQYDPRSWDDVICWYAEIDDAIEIWNTRAK